MGAHLSPEFLADYFEIVSLNSFDRQHVGDKGRVHLDGKSRGQINAEMLMRDEHDAAGRQYLHQDFADEFGVGIGEGFMGDLPDFRIRSTEGGAHRIQVRTPPGDNGRRRCRRVDLLCRSDQFGRRIVGHASLVHDVGEDARHYFNPPLAATSSISLAMFSSRLPWSISAPLPSAGTK